MTSPLDRPMPHSHWLWRTLMVYMLVMLVGVLAIVAAAEFPMTTTNHLAIETDSNLVTNSGGTVREGCITTNVSLDVTVVFTFSAPNNNSSNVPYVISVLENSFSGPFVGVVGGDGFVNVQNVTMAVASTGQGFQICIVSDDNTTYSVTESYSEPWGDAW